MAGKYLSLLVYFTWSTAGREPWIETEMRDDLYNRVSGPIFPVGSAMVIRAAKL